MAYPQLGGIAICTPCHTWMRSCSRQQGLTGPQGASAARRGYRTTAQRTGNVSSGSITTCTFFCIAQLNVRLYSGT